MVDEQSTLSVLSLLSVQGGLSVTLRLARLARHKPVKASLAECLILHALSFVLILDILV